VWTPDDCRCIAVGIQQGLPKRADARVWRRCHQRSPTCPRSCREDCQAKRDQERTDRTAVWKGTWVLTCGCCAIWMSYVSPPSISKVATDAMRQNFKRPWLHIYP